MTNNNNIIKEFENLIDFINEQNNKFILDKDIKTVTSNKFRIKQLKNVKEILKKYPEKISLENLDKLKEINGIGKGSIARIKEILETGKLSELNNFVPQSKEQEKILEDLESVVGIGHVKAIELYNQGIKSVKDLKKKYKNGEIELNDKILLGLKYYGKFFGNIPRKEIKEISKILTQIIKKINKNINSEIEYVYEICGSYRREKPFCGDIDILISKKGKLDKINYLENIINLLKDPIKKNNNEPLIIDDLTDKNIHTKYMGFCKYLDNPIRRIDIRFIPFESFYSALVYFTGSMELNKKMRQIAKIKHYKLSEYGLFKENGDKIEINSERDLFDALDIEYLHPRLR